MTTDLVKRFVGLKGQLDTERRRILTRLRQIEAALGGKAGVGRAVAAGAPRPAKRKLSRAAIARIRAAQKARWAKVKRGRGGAKAAKQAKPAKRRVSAAARAKLRAAARARWAKAKAEGRSAL